MEDKFRSDTQMRDATDSPGGQQPQPPPDNLNDESSEMPQLPEPEPEDVTIEDAAEDQGAEQRTTKAWIPPLEDFDNLSSSEGESGDDFDDPAYRQMYEGLGKISAAGIQELGTDLADDAPTESDTEESEVEEELTIEELVQPQVIDEDFKMLKKAYTSKIKLAKAAGISSQLTSRLLLAMANKEH